MCIAQLASNTVLSEVRSSDLVTDLLQTDQIRLGM